MYGIAMQLEVCVSVNARSSSTVPRSIERQGRVDQGKAWQVSEGLIGSDVAPASCDAKMMCIESAAGGERELHPACCIFRNSSRVWNRLSYCVGTLSRIGTFDSALT